MAPPSIYHDVIDIDEDEELEAETSNDGEDKSSYNSSEPGTGPTEEDETDVIMTTGQ